MNKLFAAPVSPPPVALTRYALRRDLNLWQLVFDGQHAFLRHELGLCYIAWLLVNHAETPIHGSELAVRVRARSGPDAANCETVVTDAGIELVPLTASLRQHALGLDDAEVTRRLWRKRRELDSLLESPEATEPVKAEAERELEQIEQLLSHYRRRGQDDAQRAVRAVRAAIVRSGLHLSSAVDAAGRPHPVLRAFGAHLERHLMAPSSRHAHLVARGCNIGRAGCFTYEPPPGVVWSA